MVEKSPNAFRTISEVAEIIDVPAHVLRFWESKFSQIKPVKRGGGRRYYRPTDIHLIRGIRDLLYSDGLTIKGAQKVLREQGIKHVISKGAEAIAANAHMPARAPIEAETEAVVEEATPREPPRSKSEISVDMPAPKPGMFRKAPRPEVAPPQIDHGGHQQAAFMEDATAFVTEGQEARSVAVAEKPATAADDAMDDLFGADADVVRNPDDLLQTDDLAVLRPDEPAKTPAPNRKAQLRNIYSRLETLRDAMTEDG